jgi:FkbM family methyltransferase
MSSVDVVNGVMRVRTWCRTLARVWTDPANHTERGSRLVTLFRFEIRARVFRAPTLVPYATRSVIWARRDGFSSRRAALSRFPDLPEMRVWQRALHPGDLFVDVGANVGLYTVLAAETGARVIAVEPQREAIAQLEQNLAANGYAAEIRELALADRVGCATVSGPDPNMQALVLTGADPVVGGQRVQLSTLDALVGNHTVAGVKVDVEGAERLVLEGAGRALADRRLRLIQLEWNNRSEALLGETREPVAELLHAYGYNLWKARPDGTLELADDLTFGSDLFARPANAGAARP